MRFDCNPAKRRDKLNAYGVKLRVSVEAVDGLPAIDNYTDDEWKALHEGDKENKIWLLHFDLSSLNE